MITIGFFGTPEIAKSVLDDLASHSDIEVKYVVTNPDKPVGRKQEMFASPVKQCAIEHSITVFQPEKIRGNDEFLSLLSKIDVDYIIVIAYGKILPIHILSLAKILPINIHGSLLPKYRGASPIQSALLSGETVTGITLMKMTEGMDEGDILATHQITIHPKETSGSLFQKFSDISGTFLINTLLSFKDSPIAMTEQDHAGATYTKKISKQDGFLDFHEPAEVLYRKYQAFTPWPGISTEYQGKRLILGDCDSLPDAPEGLKIGTIIRVTPEICGVVTQKGVLTFGEVKIEGARSQKIKDFLNGHKTFLGSVLASEV